MTQPETVEITVTPAFDWDTASEILMDVVQWFNNKGEPVWTEEEVSVEGLKSSYKIEESFIAYHNNKPVACMFLQESDSYHWPEVQDNSSLLTHMSMVRLTQSGTGTVRI